jgi:PKD repeat protein
MVAAAASLALALEIFAGSYAAAEPPGETVGVPWIGRAGVNERVSEIMRRETQQQRSGLVRGAAVRETHRRLPSTPAPENDHGPSSAASAVAAVASGSGGAPAYGTRAPQVVATSFLGAQISDTVGYIPPDSMGAVGPSQVMVIVNGRIKVFNKGGVVGGLNADTDVFFASVTSAGTSDPHVRYDRLSQRWFITMIDLGNPNKVVIAVSSGSTISDTSSFTFYQFQHDLVGTTPNSDTGGFADYDTLGVDKFALYVGVNEFNAAGTAFLGTTGYVVNKSNLLAGTLTVTAFRQLAPSSGSGPYTPQGVANDDPNATEGYFIGVDNSGASALIVRRVSNPGGVPSISGNLSVAVPTITAPIAQVHQGDTLNKKLDPVDNRLFSATLKENKITGISSLWTALNMQVTSTGDAHLHGPGARNGSRWYEIGTLTGTPSLLQSGTLFDSASSNPRGFWIPSVAASGQGHMALGCSYAGANDFAGVATAGRLRTDASGSIQTPALAVVSSSAYNIGESPNPHRWGDFSQTVVDPNDDMTFWTFQEYCNSANSWGVRAVQLKAPSPAIPVSASPASLAPGQSSVNVVITGSSVSGSEFFDPGPDTGGPGFANHIGAAVNGGGVTVNSVIFSNITTVILNVTVLSNAAAGARTVTVINPDGQNMISASGILTITSLGPVAGFTASPTNGPAPLAVSFTNSSTGATNYSWDFGDGKTSSTTNAANTYTNSGSYTVRLIAIGPLGTNTLARTNYIVVTNASPPPVVPAFVAAPTNGLAPVTVNFTNLSTGATNYTWDFGDGKTGSTTNAVNTYTNAGSYTVRLTAIGPAGTNTLARANYIVATNAPPPLVVPDFVAAPTNGVAPLTVNFTNLSTGATNYTWDFGDGHFSTNSNPINTYSNAGSFTVSLLAVGAGGTNTLTRTNFILAIAPAHLVIAPAGLDFGLVATDAVAQAALVVSNAGGATLNGSATVGPGTFAIVSGTPFSLAASGWTNVVIGFTPAGEGAFTNVVVFASNGGGSTNVLIGRAINPPLILSPTFGGTNFSFSFASLSGFTYLVQYKDALMNPIWQTLESVPGDGTVKPITVPTSPALQRFYRLSVQ